MPADFTYDGVALPANKVDGNPEPSSVDATKWLSATDLNSVFADLASLRSAILGGRYLALADNAAPVSAANAIRLRSFGGRLQVSQNGSAYSAIGSGGGAGLNVAGSPYNAVGDGTTDISAALQLCVNDAATQGKSVYIPGSALPYIVNTAIAVPGNISISGDGAGSVLQGPAGGTLFKVQGPHVIIKDLTIKFPTADMYTYGILFEADQTKPAAAVGQITRSGNTVTVNTVAAHGLTPGDIVGMMPGELHFLYGAQTVVTTALPTRFTFTDAGDAYTAGANTLRQVFTKAGEVSVFDTCIVQNVNFYGSGFKGFAIYANGCAEGVVENCRFQNWYCCFWCNSWDGVNVSNGWRFVKNDCYANWKTVQSYGLVISSDNISQGGAIGFIDDYQSLLGGAQLSSFHSTNDYFENNQTGTDAMTGRVYSTPRQVVLRSIGALYTFNGSNFGASGAAAGSDVCAEADSTIYSGVSRSSAEMRLSNCSLNSGITVDHGNAYLVNCLGTGRNSVVRPFSNSDGFVNYINQADGSSVVLPYRKNVLADVVGSDIPFRIDNNNEAHPNSNYIKAHYSLEEPTAIFPMKLSSPGNIQTFLAYQGKAELSAGRHKFLLAPQAFTTAGLTQNIQLGILPAQNQIVKAYIYVAGAWSGVAGTLTLKLGVTASGNELLLATDVKSAAVLIGNAAADLGARLALANVVQGGEKFTNVTEFIGAARTLNVTATSGGGNLGNGTVSNLAGGNAYIIIRVESML